MDGLSGGARPPAGHSGFPVVREVGPGAQVPDGLLHAGGVARGWPLQEGGPYGRTQPSPPHPRRGRTPGTPGNTPYHRIHRMELSCSLRKSLYKGTEWKGVF
ncbi:hypothetical protein AAG570_000777 [Ranatra chinensis]|uniref:Uncharacterized protein n=1 Tax=Ranatra chinensis TaxID=642074 RepID=A0ABD0ZLC3_9HEMI